MRDYEKQSTRRRRAVENKALIFYHELVEESDRKVRRAHTRLAMGAASMSKHAALYSQVEMQKRQRLKQMEKLEDQILDMENEIEELGEKGQVTVAKRKLDMLNKYKATYQRIK